VSLPFSPGQIVQRGRQAQGIYGLIERTFLVDGQPPRMVGMGKPARVHIVNTVTGENIPVLFNPNELTRALAVQYEDFGVMGLGHQPQHFRFTGNQEIRLTFGFQKLGKSGRAEMRSQMRFFESLCYPVRQSDRSSAPPPVLIVWPGYESIVCTAREWEEVGSRFAFDTLEPIAAVVSMAFKELRRYTLTSDIVREGR